MINPLSVAGSSIGAETVADIELKQGGEGLAAKYEAATEIDQVNCTKFPKDNSVVYLAGGTLSVDKEDGKFVFANDANRATPGALRLNQAQSTFTSTALESKIGSETVKTLTSLILNPSLVIRPSSNITPEKMWLKSLFPVLTDTDHRVIFLYRTIQVGLFAILGSLSKPKMSATEHRSYKDLGTLIIENQEFERRILEGQIKN